MAWTFDDLQDQTGKTILVTGCTAGIALHVLRHLARRNAHVVMACRSDSKMQSVASEVSADHPNAIITQVVLDTSDLDSVRSAAAAVAALNVPLDAVLLNAGIAYGPHRRSAQGHELQFATNHLGHWLLTGLLLPHLKADGRIIAVASLIHAKPTALSWDVLRGTTAEGYEQVEAYAQSKLCNMLFVAELSRRLKAAGKHVVAVACHPGLSNTDILQPHQGLFFGFMRSLSPLISQSAERGSLPLLMAVADDQADSESYYAPGGWKELWGAATRNGRKGGRAEDAELGQELWSFSESLSGFLYEMP